jgi:hypothetical protein
MVITRSGAGCALEPPVNVIELNMAEENANDNQELAAAIPAVNPYKDLRTPCAPTKFSGDGTSDPVDWWYRFERFAASHHWTEPQQLEVIGFLLTNDAGYWYRTLTAAVRQSLVQIKDVFEQQYLPDRQWAFTAALDRKQSTLETVAEYLASVRKLCSRAGVTDRERSGVLMRGFRPEIRKFVMAKQPESVMQVEQFARLAEHCAEGETGDSVLHTEVRRLTAAMDKLVASTEKSVGVTKPESQQQQGYPRQQQGYPRPQQDYQQRQQGFQQRPRWQYDQTPRPCGRCGKFGQHDCRASSVFCFKCGGMGHFARLCRT